MPSLYAVHKETKTMLVTIHKPNDNTYLIKHAHSAPMVDHIGKGVYGVHFNPVDGTIILERIRSEFRIPKQIYGDSIASNAEVIWSTYRRKQKDDCVGAIMIGPPGTGKSLTAEIICNRALIADMPVFMIKDRLPVEMLYALSALSPACVFYFDEFSRQGFVRPNFDAPPTRNRGGAADADLLTFFSDSSLKGHIFLLTDNSVDRYPEAFLNRPGRFLFRVDYGPLSVDELRKLMGELNVNPEIHQNIITYHLATPYTYDILLRLSEEINRLDTVAQQLAMLRILNVPRPVSGDQVVYVKCREYEYGQHPTDIPKITAIKRPNGKVDLCYVDDDGAKQVLTLESSDEPIAIANAHVMGVRVAWERDVPAVSIGEELSLRAAHGGQFNGPRY